MSERKHDFIPFWTCYENNKPWNNQYIQLTRELVESPEFCALNYSAQILYIRMCECACGRSSFRYSASDYEGRMPKDRFQRAKKELIEAGFITVTNEDVNRKSRKPTEFHFSNAWKPSEQAKIKKRRGNKP